MRTPFRIVKNLVTIAIVLVALFILLSFVPKAVHVSHWYHFRVVVSGSMSPTIPVGSVVVTYPTGSYQVGDIVTFYDKKSGATIPTTHRIVKIEKGANGQNLYITKGDANNTADFLKKTKSDILGEVFFHVPYAGYASYYVKEYRWPITIVLLALIILWVGWDFLRK